MYLPIYVFFLISQFITVIIPNSSIISCTFVVCVIHCVVQGRVADNAFDVLIKLIIPL